MESYTFDIFKMEREAEDAFWKFPDAFRVEGKTEQIFIPRTTDILYINGTWWSPREIIYQRHEPGY